MPEPQTEAGKALLVAVKEEHCGDIGMHHEADLVFVADALPLVEQEARDAALAEAEAAIEGLYAAWYAYQRPEPPYGFPAIDKDKALAVIAALRRSGGAG